ncbi:c-type cytochrome [Sphingomonas piscis]|uniref:c-type cytochrome n=1 Tax=Sphingomonas piscis TaxID=2714943 RepID=UPI001FE9F21B|nr:c-type cytochrome [Sphingomonas piscis]
MLTRRTPEAHAAVLAEFRKMRSGGPFMPFTVGQDTIVFPGFDGAAEWGGPAVDRASNIIYINSNEMAWKASLAENKPEGSAGQQLYTERCASCHGETREGSPPQFPRLLDVHKRLTDAQITRVIHAGKGRMPGSRQIKGEPLKALLAFLHDDPGEQKEAVGKAAPRNPYRFTGYRRWFDPDGYPAIAPPWGTLNAIDLDTGDYVWRIPFGEYPELADKTTGSENYGGPIVTAGGLLIIGATNYDRKIRAFDIRTGKLLWQHVMPYSGNATPITYVANGKQYVVIATSGSRNPKGPQGSAYVAFALP